MGFVLARTHYLQILYAIIKRIFVDVMDNLSGLKFSPKMLLHNPTMFPLSYPVLPYNSVSISNSTGMVWSLSECEGISAFFPPTKVLNAVTFHVVGVVAFIHGAFASNTFFIYQRIAVLLKFHCMIRAVAVSTGPYTASNNATWPALSPKSFSHTYEVYV